MFIMIFRFPVICTHYDNSKQARPKHNIIQISITEMRDEPAYVVMDNTILAFNRDHA